MRMFLIFLLIFSTEVFSSPKVLLETTSGEIVLELNDKKAPITVKNFLKYVEKGHYDGTIFHRVINNFMVQGGGLDKKLNEKKTFAPIKNEANNGLSNNNGTIAMARTSVVDSATSQFFINVADNDFLNHKTKAPSGYGYAVFGRVIKGMSVLSKIKHSKTKRVGHHANVPVEPIVIKKARKL